MNSIVRSIWILTLLTQCSAYGMIEGGTPATQAGLLPSITDIPQQPSLSSLNHKIKIGAIIMGATCVVSGCWYGWHTYKASCRRAEMERQQTQQNFARNVTAAIESGENMCMENISQTIRESTYTLPKELEVIIVRKAFMLGRQPIGRSLLQRFPDLRTIGLEAQADLIRQRDHLNALIACAEAILNTDQ